MRIAAFQRVPAFDDIPGTTQRLVHDLQWCVTQGVDLAVFPECFLQGYTTDRALIARRALRVDSAEFIAIAAAFKHFSLDVVLGFIQQRTDGFYNAAAVVRTGEIVGTYAKNHPNERDFLPGDGSPVFRRDDLSYGINICSDANFPASARRLSDGGAQLICYPLNNLLMPATADRWRHRSLQNLQLRARETGCWVASSDVVGTHGEKVSHGCTCIVNPDGVVVARVAEGAEGVALYEVRSDFD